jgi:hypothetical protein
VLARLLVGLIVGAGLCVVLVPVVFWPFGGGPSFYDGVGKPDWVGWVFVATLVAPMLYWVVTTRASIRVPPGMEMPEYFYQL